MWLRSTLSGLVLVCSLVSAVQVDIEGLGSVNGKEDIARDGTRYYSFLGIPYLEPPLADLRFKPGVPAKPWSGVRDATKFGNKCIQFDMYRDESPGEPVGSEDCLYINVFTKSTSVTAKKPVIFWIHGGAFIFGGVSGFGAKYMLEQDVVFVTVQYRLGVFGFLSTEDKNAPGNYGLHDQQAGLQWVQDHIHHFGGDKDKVNIMGCSAGGASVHYHLLSPRAAGLFNGAVSMSGSALCWWANLPNQRRTTVSLAEAVNCPIDSSAKLLECLRSKPAVEIMKAQNQLYAWRPGKMETEPMNIWSPRPDPEAGEDAILPVQPTLAMEVGQIHPVPFLVGIAESEGIWRAANYLTQDDVMMDFLKNFETVAPLALGLEGQVAEDDMSEVLQKIKKFYLHALTDEKDMQKRLDSTVNGMIQMLGDSMFNYPVDRMVKLHGNKDYAPVWMYEFNYKHNHSLANFDSANPGKVKKPEDNLKQLNRPTHAHELSMMAPVFEESMGPLSEDEEKQSIKFVKFIVDFAVKGVPTQDGKYEMKDWKPVANGQLTHFIFGKYSATQMGLPFQHRMKWWNALPVYWKKSVTSGKAKSVSENEESDAEEVRRYAEVAEELSPEEIEEINVINIVEELQKDEL